MSDFRFGVDDYSLNYHPHDVSDGWGGIDWDKVECVEIDWVKFVRERTCEKLPSYFEKSCIVTRGDLTMKFGYWRCSECDCENFEGARYCMACGAKVVEL